MQKHIIIVILAVLSFACKKEETNNIPPSINFKTGAYTQNGESIPVGGKLTFGIVAQAEGSTLTNIRIERISNGTRIVEIDKGIFEDKPFELTVNAVKSSAQVELWRFVAMNSNRDTAEISLSILLGEGASYGPIKHFPSVRVGMQNNSMYPNFLDLNTGTTFTAQTAAGNEGAIDLLGFVYSTSGVMSPTLSCPQYSTVPGYYPTVAGWPTRNSTLYDYNAVDNNRVKLDDFNMATNDSLLVASYKPGSVSGNCKFCFTGKIVPFKTAQGKYGLVRVIHADETPEGYMELEIKIQE